MRLGVFVIFLLLFSCGENQKTEVKGELIKDSNYESSVKWVRSKEISSAATSIKIGGKDVNINVENLSLTSNGTFDVENVYVSYDNEIHIHIELNMKNLQAVQLDDSGIIELSGPGYLNVNRYPSAFIDVYYPENSSKHRMTATFKGQTFDVLNRNTLATWHNEALDKFETDIVIDGVDHNLINADIIQELKSDEIVISIKLNKKSDG